MSEPTEIDDGGAAFPDGQGYVDGMSKREYYAAKCLAGICANGTAWSYMPPGSSVEYAVKCADALIAELKKPVDTAQK